MNATKKMWARRWARAVNYVHTTKMSDCLSDVNIFTMTTFIVQIAFDVITAPLRIIGAALTKHIKATCLLLASLGIPLAVWLLVTPSASEIQAARAETNATVAQLKAAADNLPNPACFKDRVNTRMLSSEVPITLGQMDLYVQHCKELSNADAAANLAKEQRGAFLGGVE